MRDKTYFLSDCHLGARYIADRRAHEASVVAMLRDFGRDARHIYLLGDILDYWFEYRTVVPRGYVRFFGELARLADSGVKITWLIGNHDIWLFDYLRNEIGIEIIDGDITRTIDGQVFYMAHGDALGSRLKRSFRLIRRIFRNRFCQKLYSAIHPRWTVPFALRWSSGSRMKDNDLYNTWMGDEAEPSWLYANQYLREINPDVNYFIFGHRHLAIQKDITPTCQFIILGESYSRMDYAVWDGKKLELKQFDTKQLRFNKN